MYKRNSNTHIYVYDFCVNSAISLEAAFPGLMHFQLTDCRSSLNHSTPFSAAWIQEQP